MVGVRLKHILLFILGLGILQIATAGEIPAVEFAPTLEIAKGPLCAEKPYVYLTADAFGSKPAKPPYGMYLCTTRQLTGDDAEWISQIKSIGSDVSLQLIASPPRLQNQ